MLTEQKYRLIHVLGGILFGPIKLREHLNLVWNSYFFFKEKSLISHRVSISHHLKTRSKETSKTNVVQMRAYVYIDQQNYKTDRTRNCRPWLSYSISLVPGSGHPNVCESTIKFGSFSLISWYWQFSNGSFGKKI